jgi:hypothetical protein
VDRPQDSFDLIVATRATIDAAMLDIGAGTSRLVDCLLERGGPHGRFGISDNRRVGKKMLLNA